MSFEEIQDITIGSFAIKRSNKYRKLLMLSLVLILILSVLNITVIIILCLRSTDANSEMCVTAGCVHAASTVLNYIDESLDPCDDFYQFACGGYMKNNIIPEDQSSLTAYGTINDLVMERLKNILQEPLASTAPKPYKLLQKLYNMCMNTSALEINGLETSKKMFKELGGWPLLEGSNWKEEEFDWKQLMYKFRKTGLFSGHFIMFNLIIDRNNNSRRIISMDEGPLLLNKESLIEGFANGEVQGFFNYVVDTAVLFGANRNSVFTEIKELFEFEMERAKICLSKEERRNLTTLYNPNSLRELQIRYKSIPWLEYVNNIIGVDDVKVTEGNIVNVEVPKYISDLCDLLRRTPKRVQSNFLMTNVVLSTIYTLPERFRNRFNEFSNVLTGQTEVAARWKICTKLASESIYLASGALYIKKYFDENSKQHAKEMINDVQNQFIKSLNNNVWMDDETREKALEKALAIKAHIGYPDELLDDKNINEYYTKLQFSTNDYLKSMLALALFVADRRYRKLILPVNQTDWTRLAIPTAINAYYYLQDNSMIFPAGFLQGIFFNETRPRYMNYGGIGYVMGHEITHGFDDQGQQVDKDGNVLDWWTERTQEIFKNKTRCIIDQYGNFTYAGRNLNGINTQGENIADNGGIKAAYLAYQSWSKRNHPEKRLPGLSYNPNQMFWISAANTWCSKFRYEAVETQLNSAIHSPNKFRVIVPFRNTKYFADDFSCPLGTNMNPVHKCEIW